MSDALSIATQGLQNAALRVANVSASIVNASSTTSVGAGNSVSQNVVDQNSGTQGANDLATQLVALQSDAVSYAASAKVVSVAAHTTGTIIDALA